MKRNRSRRVLAVSVSVVFCTGIGGSMSGCETAPLRGLLNSPTAMQLLSPLVKDAANAYISDLTSLTGLLANVNSLDGVMNFVSVIQPMIDKLTSAYNTLSNTTGDERKWLLVAFGPKINSANAGFLNQSDDATSNWAWNKVLGSALDQVRLFE